MLARITLIFEADIPVTGHDESPLGNAVSNLLQFKQKVTITKLTAIPIFFPSEPEFVLEQT